MALKRPSRPVIGYTILALAIVLGLWMQYRDIQAQGQTSANLQRQTQRLAAQDRAIQASREHSCKQTYEGIREVFKPFFPKPGEKTTPEQRANLKKFNTTVDRLKGECTLQTKPKPQPRIAQPSAYGGPRS